MPKQLTLVFIGLLFALILSSCNGKLGGDARKNPPNPDERVKKNLEEGKGFRLDNMINGAKNKGGTFDFASSNELWRASLDTIDFMPLLSANYSGGIIITDWYSEDEYNSIKVTVRFLSNEIRSDAIDIKIFYKSCDNNFKCVTKEKKDKLNQELKKEILKKATIYKKQTKDKKFKTYSGTGLKN